MRPVVRKTAAPNDGCSAAGSAPKCAAPAASGGASTSRAAPAPPMRPSERLSNDARFHQSPRAPAARTWHMGEVVRQQQQCDPLIEAVVVVGLEMLGFGEKSPQLLERTSEACFEICRQRG